MTLQVSASPSQSGFPDDRKSDGPPRFPDEGSSIPVRILVVDDDPGILTAMETLLDGPNRTIVTASTGQDALRHLLRQDFAVILLDVRMPRLDGYETASLIRQRKRSRYTPIIFLSGIDTMDTDVFRGLTSGAVDYLVKPVMPEVLQNKVSIFVDLYRLRERVKQQAVRQSEERFRLLVEGVQDYAIFMLDREGLVATWNAGAGRLTGYRTEEILGRHYECFYPKEELATCQPAQDLLAAAAAAEEARAEQDRWMIQKDGTRFVANVVVTGLRDDQGSLQGFAVVIRDITERKKAEETLQRLTAELEQRVMERTKELVLVHERLRALSIQLNLTEQRERRRLAMDLHDYLAQLLVVVRMKLSQTVPLVSDSKSTGLLKEADQAITKALGYTQSLVAELAPLALHEFGLLPALEWLASQMQRHGLSIMVEQDIDTLSLPEDQAVLLFQSVRELLFNVMKHARANQATVFVAVTREHTLEVTVVDDGSGFDTASLTVPGPGANRFGLFSIRERMESMGGRFEVQSTIGQGTRATLIVPYWPVEAASAAPLTTQPSVLSTEGDPSPSAVVPRLRVLLVDDHAMVRQGLCSLLEGHEDVQVVGEAGDGMGAIELAAVLRPDVVVMDVTMPHIDGIEATRQIRQNHPSTVVVGLSVHEASQVEAAMKAAGATAFISKESAGEELYEAIMAAVGTTRGHGQGTQPIC